MKSERDGINPAAEPSGTGCVECLALGGWWFHLRRCAECGHIGCCDSSPNQHASKHYAATGHPIITSFEPGERWFYDYRTEAIRHRPEASALLTRIRWINRRPDRRERCLQIGKRCFTNRMPRNPSSARQARSSRGTFAASPCYPFNRDRTETQREISFHDPNFGRSKHNRCRCYRKGTATQHYRKRGCVRRPRPPDLI